MCNKTIIQDTIALPRFATVWAWPSFRACCCVQCAVLSREGKFDQFSDAHMARFEFLNKFICFWGGRILWTAWFT